MSSGAAQSRRSSGKNAPVDSGEYTSRQKALSLAVALLLLASVVVAVAVSSGGDGDGGGDIADLPTADGVLVLVQPDRLRMRLQEPIDGQLEVDFHVRPEDQADLNVAHLQIHAADGLPTRIFYEEDDGRYVARSAVDLPSFR